MKLSEGGWVTVKVGNIVTKTQAMQSSESVVTIETPSQLNIYATGYVLTGFPKTWHGSHKQRLNKKNRQASATFYTRVVKSKQSCTSLAPLYVIFGE